MYFIFLENLVRGLDDDEAGFLDFVDKTKIAEERKILKEEESELEEYRKAVAKEHEERIMSEVKSISSVPLPKSSSSSTVSIGAPKESQRSKLNSLIVRKRSSSEGVLDEAASESKKAKTSGKTFIYSFNYLSADRSNSCYTSSAKTAALDSLSSIFC